MKLIEDYFYPESSPVCLDPSEHTPIIQMNEIYAPGSRKYKPRPTLNFLEGSQALREVTNKSAATLLNCSIIQTIRKIIKIDDEDIASFDNWDKDTTTSYTNDVKADIRRSRIRDSTEKDSILEDLLLVIIFYCENNTIVYQQGMQDIFIPFVYLKSKEFTLAEVYAYSKGYIDMFMPNTLHSKFNGKDYSLPHLQCQLSLLKMLLKYHDIDLYNHFNNMEIQVEAFATPWILTQFSRVVDFTLIYELIEIILFERDQLMALYMSIALLKRFKAEILSSNAIESLLPLLQKRLKVLNIKELCQLYYESVAIRSRTPVSFAILIQKLKINDPATVISNEEIKELQDLELETFIVYPEELTSCVHLYNTCNNDKSMNKLYSCSNQNKYVTSEIDEQNAKDIQSITSINILKRDCSNDTEIGKNVKFAFIDLTNKKKAKTHFKDAIIPHGVKGSSALEVLQSSLCDLRKCNVLIITSDHKVKLDSSEVKRLEETLQVCSYLGISRVSVLKGGLKGYINHL